MNRFFYVIIILGICSCTSSISNISSTCLLVPKHQYVMLYSMSGGNTIVDSIINDTIKEDYVGVSMLKIKGRRAQIIAKNAISQIVSKGWIEKKHLGIYPVSTSLLLLYDSPKKNAHVCDSIENVNWGDFLYVKKHNKRWLYVEYKQHQGWMSPEDQCDNPYSSCN